MDDPRGHYLTAGYTLAGLGLFTLLIALVALLLEVDLGFIDARSMAGISAGMLAVGSFMGRKGRAA